MAPIREYLCKDCGYGDSPEWTEIQGHGDPDPKKCPRCESERVERLISAFGGYSGNMGGGSTRPRQAASFRGKVKR